MKTYRIMVILTGVVCSLMLFPIFELSAVKDDLPGAPKMVYFRTNKETYNSAFYAMTRDGHIYFKPNVDRTGVDGPWKELDLPPALEGNVVEIALDDKFLMAMNSKRELWQMSGALGGPENYKWYEFRGYPFVQGPLNVLPEDIVKWDFSVVSPEEDVNYPDKIPVGSATCAHLIVLKKGGRWISFNDGWLPADLNYEICGPKRGRFKAVNLSASGSTFYIMNRFGDMFTTIWDYDLSGPNRIFLKYSYYDQTKVKEPVHQLPPAPWIMHPKIKGRITDRISLHKIGKDCIHRIMRVEGMDEKGNTGYYEKDITQMKSEDWVFHRTDEPLDGHLIDNKPYDSSDEDLGEVEDYSYSMNMANVDKLQPEPAQPESISDADWAGEILDFNCYCSPATIRVYLTKGKHIDLILHTTETVRRKVKNGRGLDNIPREKNGCIEVPRALLDGLDAADPKTKAFIKYFFDNQRFTDVNLTATTNRVRISKKNLVWSFTR